MNWRLPTKEELNLIHKRLGKRKIVGFVCAMYWTSSEISTSNAWTQNFYNGYQSNYHKVYLNRVRLVRTFTSTEDYKIGQETQTGFVFNVQGNTVYECKKYDEPDRMTWDEAMEKFGGKQMKNEGWRLPTKEELDIMYGTLHRRSLGEFSDDFYWSSSEYDRRNAWAQCFESGNMSDFGKYLRSRVRLVRTFVPKVGGDKSTEFIYDFQGNILFEYKKEDEPNRMTWYEAMALCQDAQPINNCECVQTTVELVNLQNEISNLKEEMLEDKKKIISLLELVKE